VHTNGAWRRCIQRFAEVELFVDQSASVLVRGGPPSFRSDLYGSWVLMAYAACQFALVEIGRGCMDFLGSKYRRPNSLPPDILRIHQKMTLDGIRGMVEDAGKTAQFYQAIQDLHSSEWSRHSNLLKMERNVWPNNVKEWLRRLGVTDGAMKWMTESVPGKTDTYESRMSALVEERNPIAHGESPSNILSSGLMKDWIADCRAFMENCAMTVEFHLSREHAPRLRKYGIADRKVSLGNRTVGLKSLNYALAIGDHVLLASSGVRKKIARVDSIMSAGVMYESLGSGSAEVAIGLSKPHQNCDVFLAP
jgi:hypothetical protein